MFGSKECNKNKATERKMKRRQRDVGLFCVDLLWRLGRDNPANNLTLCAGALLQRWKTVNTPADYTQSLLRYEGGFLKDKSPLRVLLEYPDKSTPFPPPCVVSVYGRGQYKLPHLISRL
jgi:hypothetical protein